MAYELTFADDFDGDDLDLTRWLPYYLPHWSSRARTAARYEVADGRLRLFITADDEPWCPEYDGDIRASVVQTGLFAGPVGSGVGQGRFRSDLVVREEQENVALYTPQYGKVEIRMNALDHPRFMAALWMIGYEDEPDRSGEICVCEIFGRDVEPGVARVGMGIKRIADPSLVQEFAAEPVAIDARELHTYAAEWTPEQVTFTVDGGVVKSVSQSPAYPMQLMLGMYEFPPEPGSERAATDYPQAFEVDFVRGYRLVD